MIGKIVKNGVKKALLAGPVVGLALVSVVVAKYFIDDLKAKNNAASDPAAPEETGDGEDKENEENNADDAGNEDL